MRTCRFRGCLSLLLIALCAGTVSAQASAGRSTRRTATPPKAAPRATQQKATAQKPSQQKPAPAKSPVPAAPKTASGAGTPARTSGPTTQSPAAQAAQPAGGAATQPAAPIPPEVLYTPPKSNSVPELSAFLARLLDYQPRTDEELAEFQKRAPQAMNNAATRIMQLEKDQKSAAYRFAMNYVIAMQLMEFDKASAQDRQKIYNYISASLTEDTLDPDVLDLAVAFAENLEFAGETKLAAQTYAAFAAKIAKSTDPLVVELANSLNASARRLNLVGHPMQILGKTTDGKPFRWTDYRGKVVIVDFWATWCGPCIAEFPRLKKHFDTYGKSGLEIVGISLDQDPAQLQAFLQKNPVPWITLHEGDSSIHPTAKYYGISALPTTMVVDRQGNVVALNARGEELDALLAQLFGQAQSGAVEADRR